VSLGDSVVATVRGLMTPEGSEAVASEEAAAGPGMAAGSGLGAEDAASGEAAAAAAGLGTAAGAGGRAAAGGLDRLEEGTRSAWVGRHREDPEPMEKVRGVVAHVRRLHRL
jgi:hypothetical protein